METGDIVLAVDCESLPVVYLGSLGIVTDVGGSKVLVKFKCGVKGMGSLSHTALVSDLKKIGEVKVNGSTGTIFF